jgi:DNA-binding NtrC family response regulator
MVGDVHILLVDDSANFLMAGQELLRSQHPRSVIAVAADAERALFTIRQQDYHVIISDIRLPGLDGLQLLTECQRIRPDTPVILISGYGDRDIEDEAARAGAYAFLHKPVDPDAFCSVVQRAVLRAQMRRKPELVLGEDTHWYMQAREQIHRRSDEINERLRQVLKGYGVPPDRMS